MFRPLNKVNPDTISLIHKKIWDQKPTLQAIYTHYFQRLTESCVSGRILEIGGGIGGFRTYSNQVVSMDIQSFNWLDIVADAHFLPFKSNSFSNIVMLDVLHHLECPKIFFLEAVRVLVSGGRIVLIEPAITPLSWLIYKYFHYETVDMTENPLTNDTFRPGRLAFDGNQAIPTILFNKNKDEFEQTFPQLKIMRLNFFSFFSYLLSGGYQKWCLLPAKSVPIVLSLEKFLDKFAGKYVALRLHCVLQTQSKSNN